jgi:hypothetical protein
MAALQRTIVIGDLHLGAERSRERRSGESTRELDQALAALVAAHAGSRLVLPGDLFDLATDGHGRRRTDVVHELLGRHPAIRAALGSHVEGGGSLCLAAGNHDPDLGEPELRSALCQALELSAEATPRLRTSPWFIRDGALHIEHGHMYDPDNASAHPLVVGAPSLGTHFCAQFLLPTGAHHYLLTNDSTPAKLFVAAFTHYGWRGPHVVFRYFYAAFAALGRSGPLYRAKGEAERGQARHSAFAAQAAVPVAMVDALADVLPVPTFRSLPGTFARLYLDRSLPTAAIVAGAAAATMRRRRLGMAFAGLGAATLVGSWIAGHDRYRGNVIERLRDAAATIREVTAAKLVVLAHTHHEQLAEGYANAGSFAVPREQSPAGRPFLEIEGLPEEPRAVLRRWP